MFLTLLCPWASKHAGLCRLDKKRVACFPVSIISWLRANKCGFLLGLYTLYACMVTVIFHLHLAYFTICKSLMKLLTSFVCLFWVTLWASCWANRKRNGTQNRPDGSLLYVSCCQRVALLLTSHMWQGLNQVQAFCYISKQDAPLCLTVLLLLCFFSYQYMAFLQPLLFSISSGAFTDSHSHS